MQTQPIWANAPYPVYAAPGLLGQLGACLAQHRAPCRVAVVSDRNTHRFYAHIVIESLRAHGFAPLDCQIPHDEREKELHTAVAPLLSQLADGELTRGDLVLALGGGLVQDVAAVAAGLYLRGVDFVSVPTTPHAALHIGLDDGHDVHLPRLRDGIGLYGAPCMVLCDPDTFSSLRREVAAVGWADAVRIAFVAGGDLWQQVREATPQNLAALTPALIAAQMDFCHRESLLFARRQWMSFGQTLAAGIGHITGYLVAPARALALGMLYTAAAAAASELCPAAPVAELYATLRRGGIDCDTPYTGAQLARGVCADYGRFLPDERTVALIIPGKTGVCTCTHVHQNNLPGFLQAAHRLLEEQ